MRIDFIDLFDWTCAIIKVETIFQEMLVRPLNLLITFIFSGTSVVQKEEKL